MSRTTVFEYDLRDRLTLRRYPDLSEDRFDYDAENNRILHRDAGNQAHRYTYDALKRQSRRPRRRHRLGQTVS